jgi:hypothetical protein
VSHRVSPCFSGFRGFFLARAPISLLDFPF